MEKKTAILILGMHRSGTSAITRCLNLLGVDLGSNLMPAAGDNELGFWENSTLVDINERLLASLGSSWDDPSLLPPEWWKLETVQPFKAELLSVLALETGESAIWAFKDPRLCVLLPLWKEILGEAGQKVLAVLPVRNPLEVASSLAKRNGTPLWKAQFLWLKHTLLAEKESRGIPRAFVSYDRLLAEPIATLRGIEARLGMEFPISIEAASPRILEYLSPSRRHHRRDDSALESEPGVSPWVSMAYGAFLRACEGCEEPDFDRELAPIQAEWARVEPLMRPALSELSSFQASFQVSSRDLQAAERKIQGIEKELKQASAYAIEKETELDVRLKHVQELNRDIGRHQQVLQIREVELQECRRLLAERDETVARMRDLLALKDDGISQVRVLLDHKMQELEQARVLRETQEREFGRVLALREQLEGMRVAAEQGANQARAELEAYRASSQAELEACRASSQAELETLRGSSENWTAKTQAELEACLQALREKEMLLKDAETSLQIAKDCLATASGQLGDERQRATQVFKELERVLNSRTWRATWPIRASLDRLKQLIRGSGQGTQKRLE